MKIRADIEKGWVDPSDDLDSLPEFLLDLGDGAVVYVKKLSTIQWSIHRTAPDLDGIGPDGLFPYTQRLAYLNRRPSGGWVGRMEVGDRIVSLAEVRIEDVVSNLLGAPVQTDRATQSRES